MTDGELVTAFTRAEDPINSRLLTYQTQVIKDNVPLTPNHILFGRSCGNFAATGVDGNRYNLQKRWRCTQLKMYGDVRCKNGYLV